MLLVVKTSRDQEQNKKKEDQARILSRVRGCARVGRNRSIEAAANL